MAGVTKTGQLQPWDHGAPSGEEIGQRDTVTAGVSAELVVGMALGGRVKAPELRGVQSFLEQVPPSCQE